MLDELRGALYIAKKDLKEYYLKPPTVSWGIAFPLVFAFAFLLRGWDRLWLAPGLLTISLFFGSTSMSAASIVPQQLFLRASITNHNPRDSLDIPLYTAA